MHTLGHIRHAISQHPMITDSVIALIFAGVSLVQLWVYWDIRPDQTITVDTAVTTILLSTIPLIWRRRYPLTVTIIVVFAVITHRHMALVQGVSGYAMLLAYASAAAYGGRWRLLVFFSTYIVVMGDLTYIVIQADISPLQSKEILLKSISMLLNYSILAGAWVFGAILRNRQEREDELAQRTAQLELEREENARRAVLDERVRIARELHDVVAHHVSVMGVQAGAARRVLEKQPEKAQAALSVIESSSRQAVAELHRLLGFLRQESQTDEKSPQPSLRQLNTLVNDMKEAGLPVEVNIEGTEQSLPPGVDLSAYRIVQEALTNTLKHAGPAKARVSIRYTDKAVELEILDNGQGPPPTIAQPPGGNGLIGMRERASLHDGEFEAGRLSEGGFLVRAVLPIAGGIQ